MLGKQTNTLQAVSDHCILQAVSSVWRSLLNKGSDLSFVLLFAIAEAAAEETLAKVVETEVWLTIGRERARSEMDISQQNTQYAHPHCSCSSLPALTAFSTCPVSLPHTGGAHKIQVFPILSLHKPADSSLFLHCLSPLPDPHVPSPPSFPTAPTCLSSWTHSTAPR